MLLYASKRSAYQNAFVHFQYVIFKVCISYFKSNVRGFGEVILVSFADILPTLQQYLFYIILRNRSFRSSTLASLGLPGAQASA